MFSTFFVPRVNDFGREYELERRYEEFSNLHADLSRICGPDALAPLPEKKMWMSTDQATVEERKPKLNHVGGCGYASEVQPH